MGRWFLVTFIFACLFYFVQAFPQSAAPAEATTASSDIEISLSNIMETMQNQLKQIIENPNLDKLVQDGQRLLENAAASIQNEAAKIVPKTN